MKVTKEQLQKMIQEALKEQPGSKNPRVELSPKGAAIRFDVSRDGALIPLFWTGNGFKREHAEGPLVFKSKEEAEKNLPAAIGFINRWRKEDAQQMTEIASEVTMHSVAPPSEPEKLFPTDDVDIIRKWMGQVNDLIKEMESRKFSGAWSLGGGISSHGNSTRQYAIGLLTALRESLRKAKQGRNNAAQQKAKRGLR